MLNGGNIDFLDDLISDDYIDHNPVPGTPLGIQGVKTKVLALRNAFPDIHFAIEELISERMIVAARYYWQEIQTESFMDIPPSGKTVCVTGMDFYRIKNGKIAEHWHNIDELGMLRQLGVITS